MARLSVLNSVGAQWASICVHPMQVQRLMFVQGSRSYLSGCGKRLGIHGCYYTSSSTLHKLVLLTYGNMSIELSTNFKCSVTHGCCNSHDFEKGEISLRCLAGFPIHYGDWIIKSCTPSAAQASHFAWYVLVSNMYSLYLHEVLS